MKLFKTIILFFIGMGAYYTANAQANASINILTQNSGQVAINGTVFIQVDIGNTGPTASIGANKVRAQISVPVAIVNVLSTAEQTGLPAGWTVVTNTLGGITVCNGSDVIPVNAVRTVLIAVKGIALGGPSTVTGVLSFGPGTGVCTGPGSLAGDITADNTSTSSIQVITAAACNLAVSASTGAIACNGGTTTLTAAPTGANGTVEYSITGGAPFQTANTFTVTAGTYTVTAREINNPGCTATATAVTITQPAVITAPVTGTITQPNCTVATGSVLLSGLPAGNWTITQDPGAVTTTGNSISTSINGLAAGSYTFTVTSGAGCLSPASSLVTINAQPIPTAPVVNIIQPTCTVATGTITVTSTTIGSTFSVDAGGYASYPTGGYNLSIGSHTITVQNSSGCISAVTNIVINAQPASPSAPAPGAITQPTCAVSTGSVVLNNLPAGNWTINPGNITGSTTTTTVNNLAEGTYDFTVTNAAGCISPASADVIINGVPGAPVAPVVSIVQPTCAVATGTITITSSTAGFTFSLDGAAYATYPASGYTVSAGAHTLIAQNAGNCTSAITNITVDAQPATPVAPTISIAQPTCSISTGTVTITSVTTGFTFSIDGAGYTAYPSGGYNLVTGSHTVTVKNAGGCVSSATNITVNAQPTSPTATAAAGTVACNGGNTTLTVTATGGVAPLQYSLNGGTFQAANTFNVGAGVYTVTVKDVNLCSATTAVLTVIQPTVITTTASASAIACGTGTGTITVIATGGTAPLQYSLNGGAFQTANTFTVGAGTYTVNIKDANGCTAVADPVTIAQADPLIVTARAPRITQCGGTTTVTLTATGGTAPYQLPAGGPGFIKGPGDWSFMVTDAGGCSTTAHISIEAPGCTDLKVYPNPASNSISIDHSAAAPGSLMKVYDINGALVINKGVPQNAFQTTVDIRKLAAGSYVVVYFNGNEKKEILFVKVNER